jgi:hypothetical protein
MEMVWTYPREEKRMGWERPDDVVSHLWESFFIYCQIMGRSPSTNWFLILLMFIMGHK